jgi:hypothetical protein
MSHRRFAPWRTAVPSVILLFALFVAEPCVLAAPQFRPLGHSTVPPLGYSIEVDQGSEHLLHRPPIYYPREALENRVQGQVALLVNINA